MNKVIFTMLDQFDLIKRIDKDAKNQFGIIEDKVAGFTQISFFKFDLFIYKVRQV